MTYSVFDCYPLEIILSHLCSWLSQNTYYPMEHFLSIKNSLNSLLMNEHVQYIEAVVFIPCL